MNQRTNYGGISVLWLDTLRNACQLCYPGTQIEQSLDPIDLPQYLYYKMN